MSRVKFAELADGDHDDFVVEGDGFELFHWHLDPGTLQNTVCANFPKLAALEVEFDPHHGYCHRRCCQLYPEDADDEDGGDGNGFGLGGYAALEWSYQPNLAGHRKKGIHVDPVVAAKTPCPLNKRGINGLSFSKVQQCFVRAFKAKISL